MLVCSHVHRHFRSDLVTIITKKNNRAYQKHVCIRTRANQERKSGSKRLQRRKKNNRYLCVEIPIIHRSSYFRNAYQFIIEILCTRFYTTTWRRSRNWSGAGKRLSAIYVVTSFCGLGRGKADRVRWRSDFEVASSLFAPREQLAVR